MSVAADDSRLDLNKLTDEVIQRHRLANSQQSVAAAVRDLATRIRGREQMVLLDLLAEKIRSRVTERAAERMAKPVYEAPKPTSRNVPVPDRVPPAEPEIPDVPEPASGEEFRPGAVLFHTTQSQDYDEAEPETVAAPVSTPKPAPVPARAPEVLTGLVRRPAPAQPVPFRAPAPVQQPSFLVDAMRSMSPKETWGSLAEMVDVGGTRKQRGKLTEADLAIRFEFARTSERDASKELTEAQKSFSAAHREMVLAGRELEAVRRHRVELVEDLPAYELDRLYGKHAA